jgi:hypothetical protein
MHYDYGTFAWVRDWQDEPGPYYRVNYGNGQVSEVYHGPGARKRTADHAASHGTWWVQRYVEGGDWFRVRA